MPSSASASPERYTLSLHDALPISAVEHRVRGLVDEHSHIHAAQDLHRLARLLRRVGRDADVERLALPHRRGQGAHRLVERRVGVVRSEEHTSELQSPCNLVCRLLLPRRPSATPFPYTTLFRSQRLSIEYEGWWMSIRTSMPRRISTASRVFSGE